MTWFMEYDIVLPSILSVINNSSWIEQRFLHPCVCLLTVIILCFDESSLSLSPLQDLGVLVWAKIILKNNYLQIIFEKGQKG